MAHNEGLPGSSEYPRILDVPKDEWGAGGLGTILRTVDVDPCLVIGVYNPGKGAILGHFSDPMNIHHKKTAKSFGPLIDLLALSSNDIPTMRFWIGGGSTVISEDNLYTEQVDANVDYMLERVKELGVEEGMIDFGLSGHYEMMEVEINADDGSIKVLSEKLPEDIADRSESRK